MLPNRSVQWVLLAIETALGFLIFARGAEALLMLAASVMFVFVIPGLSLVFALLPESQVDSVAWLLILSSLSIGQAVAGGLILNMLPGGLSLSNWVIYEYTVVLFCAGISLCSGKSKAKPDFNQWRMPHRHRQVARWSLSAAVSILALASAFALSRYGSQAQPRQGFTQFHAIPKSDTASVGIGIHNYELRSMSYSVALVVREEVVWSSDPIILVDGATWALDVDLPPAQVADEYVEVILYRLDAPGTAYREAHFWR